MQYVRKRSSCCLSRENAPSESESFTATPKIWPKLVKRRLESSVRSKQLSRKETTLENLHQHSISLAIFNLKSHSMHACGKNGPDYIPHAIFSIDPCCCWNCKERLHKHTWLMDPCWEHGMSNVHTKNTKDEFQAEYSEERKWSMAAKPWVTMKRCGLEKMQKRRCDTSDVWHVCPANDLRSGLRKQIQYKRCAATLTYSWTPGFTSGAIRITTRTFVMQRQIHIPLWKSLIVTLKFVP